MPSGLNHSRKSCSKLIPVSSCLKSTCGSISSSELATDSMKSLLKKFGGTAGSEAEVGCTAGFTACLPFTPEGDSEAKLELVSLGETGLLPFTLGGDGALKRGFVGVGSGLNHSRKSRSKSILVSS